MEHPINHIYWIDCDLLDANDWNPNHVFGPEMKLLELSLLTSGWIQPILVVPAPAGRYVSVDGFDRVTVARASPRVRQLTAGLVPCAVLDIPEAERMLLTVRINRAKGAHTALKMHDLVRRLIEIEGCSRETVAKGIGAAPGEIDLLLRENVFSALEIPDHAYSKAWVPKPKA
jgi:ParB-like chromosome segregation protein Spo0J